jgi:hypothetical protein
MDYFDTSAGSDAMVARLQKAQEKMVSPPA